MRNIERVQVANIARTVSATFVEKFPINLGIKEVGILLAIRTEVEFDDATTGIRLALSSREATTAQVANYDNDKESILWVGLNYNTIQTVAGDRVKTIEHKFEFPYPIMFINPPFLFGLLLAGGVNFLIAQLYYIKAVLSEEELAKAMVKGY